MSVDLATRRRLDAYAADPAVLKLKGERPELPPRRPCPCHEHGYGRPSVLSEELLLAGHGLRRPPILVEP